MNDNQLNVNEKVTQSTLSGHKFTRKVLKNVVLGEKSTRITEKLGRDARLILNDWINDPKKLNSSYPELSAQSCNEHKTKLEKVLLSDSYKNNRFFKKHLVNSECNPSMLRLKCDSGHLINKALFCGREWCKTCGDKNSIYHVRRVSKWIPKYSQITTVGYLVITIPKQVRNKFKSKYDLNNFRTYVRRKLKRDGFAGFPVEHGFLRYHFAGDCKYCKGRKCAKCEMTGADKEYHPHLNILIPTNGHVSEDELGIFRRDAEQWLSIYTHTDLRGLGNVHYSYGKTEIKKKHLLKYVTRATWRFYDSTICTIIKNFRIGVSFGKWDKLTFNNSNEATENNCCPVCLKEDGAIIRLKKMTYAIQSSERFQWSKQIQIGFGIYIQRE